MRKKEYKEKKGRPGILLLLISVLLLNAGCARGGLFRADDYYLVNGSGAEAAGSGDEADREDSEPAPEDLAKAEKVSDKSSLEDSPRPDQAEAWRDVMQTVWIAYWDGHIAEALDLYGSVIENICIFAACYDPEGGVFLPEDLNAQYQMIREKDPDHRWTYYLSVTNDVLAAAWSSAKDTDLLHHLLDDPENAEKHAETLAALAAENGYDGLEIDYECLHSDMELWKGFLHFEEALLAETEERGLKLRIVLEPATPKEGLSFPEGPEYVMMCYDLHGFGTEPGAKADQEFLTALVNDFSFVPGLEYALANGGFDWNLDTGYVTTMSEQNIQELLAGYDFEKQRGDTSGALYGTYAGDGDEQHTVWYADLETLQLWYQYLCDASGRQVRCSLWKL